MVWGLGFRVEGIGLGVWVEGSGSGVQDLGFRFENVGCRVYHALNATRFNRLHLHEQGMLRNVRASLLHTPRLRRCCSCRF
jgi:hypothetical protein